MSTETKLRKNGHRHGGGWNDNTPRLNYMQKRIPLYIMVTRSEYTKAKIHLEKEAEQFRLKIKKK